MPRLCGGAGECDDDYMCQDSMCVPQCNADEDCALNERCSKGACMCKYFVLENIIRSILANINTFNLTMNVYFQ